MSRARMDQLGWDSCGVIIVTGDATSITRALAWPSSGGAGSAGLRVGMIARPGLAQRDAFAAPRPAEPVLGITAANMDSMVNRYTPDRRVRSGRRYTRGVSVAGAGPAR